MSLAETMFQTHPEKFGLWPSVWRLLRLRARLWWNAFRRSKLRNKIGTVVLLLLALGGMAFLFFLSTLLLRFLQSPEVAGMLDAGEVLRAMPTLVLTGAFVIIILTNFGVLLQALYLSRDMDFLVTTPLPMRAVFLAKLTEAILPNFGLFAAFSLPVLFGLGISSGYNILYYPLLVLMLVALALAAGGIASILVMAVVRVVPARRVAEVLGVVGGMASVLCGQSGNLINAFDPESSDVAGTLNMFTQLDTGWSPIAWAGRGLVSIGSGEWLPGIGLTLLAFALAGTFFAGTLLLAERLYYTGWAAMQGSVRKKRRERNNHGKTIEQPMPVGAAAAASAARTFAMLPRAIAGMVKKDLLILRRDPRNLSQLITPLIVGVAMTFSTRGGGRNGAAALTNLGMRNLEVYGTLVLAIFVGWMLMYSLATLSFSREGRSYWLIKTAPLPPWHLLAAKFLVSYLPALLFCLAYLTFAFSVNHVAWALFPYALMVVALAMAGATGISLAYGVAGANFEWDSPQRQRLSGSMGCFSVLAIVGFLAIDLALMLLPPALWQIFGSGAAGSPSDPWYAYLLGIALGLVTTALSIFLPLRLVVGKLQHIGE